MTILSKKKYSNLKFKVNRKISKLKEKKPFSQTLAAVAETLTRKATKLQTMKRDPCLTNVNLPC